MIVIDQAKVFDEIRRRSPTSVSLNGPDGILPQVQQVAQNITAKFGIPAFVVADTTWGSCDTNIGASHILKTGIHFNIGHTISLRELDGAVMIDAYDDISFESVAQKCIRIVSGKVGLLTDSQHLHRIEQVRQILEGGGIEVVIGSGKGQLNDGQVFGCEFYPAHESLEQVDSFVFLGQSSFHAAGVSMSTGKPVYILDPYFNEVHDVSKFAARLQRQATLAIYKAAEAQRFGIVIGLREGQLSRVVGMRISSELNELGKETQLFALTDITNERLKNLRGVDAFIQTACPRISTDNHFDMPVLSTPQANALIRVLRGQDIDGYLKLPHWL